MTKVLLGGVPFGENNVGDEAILECVTATVRDLCPHADITVSTNDREATARKLGVKAVPLFASSRAYSLSEMRAAVEDTDVFIWSGATGLSDYPEAGLTLLSAAQAARRKTVLWGVGMNDELNPYFYKVLPGKRRTMLEAVTKFSACRVDAVAFEEFRRRLRARKKIAGALNACSLVVLRDAPSRNLVYRCGVERAVVVGADPALELRPAPLAELTLPEDSRSILRSDKRKVGVCISAQRALEDRRGLVTFLDRLVADDSSRVVFIPMNPITDAALMSELHRQMAYPSRAALVSGQYEPSEVAGLAAEMDLVVTSRLHLLILASISHVPLIGIARGSKIDNFLAPYGLVPVGSVDHCDFSVLWEESQRLLRDRTAFEMRSRLVREDYLRRLHSAKVQLRAALEAP